MNTTPCTRHLPTALALAAAIAASGCGRSPSDADDFFRAGDAAAPAGPGSPSSRSAAPRVDPVVVQAPEADAIDAGRELASRDADAQESPGRAAAEGYIRRHDSASIAARTPAAQDVARAGTRSTAAPRITATQGPDAPVRDAPPRPADEAATPAPGAAPIGGDARALNARAIALINGGRPQDAIPLLEHALVIQPRDAEMLGNLGYAYMLVGEHARARSRFITALELAPTRSATWLNLGQTYAELGRRDVAVDAVLKGYRYSTRKATVRSALQRAATDRQFSAAWREAASVALGRIEGGA